MNSQQIDELIARMATELAPMQQAAEGPFALIGLHTGGVWVARRLAEKMGNPPVHELDVSFYRDDFSTIGLHPSVGPSQIEADIDGRTVILVDDVLYTGRTIRAALDALIDFGRPRSLQLIVLVDRGHRELPIKADYVGKNLPTAMRQSVRT